MYYCALSDSIVNWKFTNNNAKVESSSTYNLC